MVECQRQQHHFILVPDGPIRFDDVLAVDGNIYRMTLMNFGTTALAFKFQTTAPHLFCCKPVVGFVRGQHQLSVRILLKWWKLKELNHSEEEELYSFRLITAPLVDMVESPKSFWMRYNNDESRLALLHMRHFRVHVDQQFYTAIKSIFRKCDDDAKLSTTPETRDRSAQTIDNTPLPPLPNAVERRFVVDELVDELCNRAHRQRHSIATSVQSDQSITEICVPADMAYIVDERQRASGKYPQKKFH